MILTPVYLGKQRGMPDIRDLHSFSFRTVTGEILEPAIPAHADEAAFSSVNMPRWTSVAGSGASGQPLRPVHGLAPCPECRRAASDPRFFALGTMPPPRVGRQRCRLRVHAPAPHLDRAQAASAQPDFISHARTPHRPVAGPAGGSAARPQAIPQRRRPRLSDSPPCPREMRGGAVAGYPVISSVVLSEQANREGSYD